MECCFNHKDVEKEMSCFYCGKAFCKDCLMLQGKRKIVICRDCHSYFTNNLQKSRTSRYILIGFGSLLSVFALYLTSLYYATYNAYAMVFLVLGLVVLGTVVFNVIRVRQIREWLVIEEYKRFESRTID